MAFLPDEAWLELLDVRATDPTAIGAALAARTTRPLQGTSAEAPASEKAA